jgi:hypothetical protein
VAAFMLVHFTLISHPRGSRRCLVNSILLHSLSFSLGPQPMAVSKTDQQDLNQLSAAADAAFPDVPCVASPRPSSFQTLSLPPGWLRPGLKMVVSGDTGTRTILSTVQNI